VLINHLVRLAQENGVKLQAEFLSTDRNRMMYLTYKFAGFKEKKEQENFVLFENDFSQIQPFPSYMRVVIGEA
jgi:predicted enzyme involved in methoxymalonyl-ACP biosynthesis